MGVYHDEVVFFMKGGKSTCTLCYGLVGHTQGDSGAHGKLLRVLAQWWHSWASKNGCERLPSILPYIGECYEDHQEVGCEGKTG